MEPTNVLVKAIFFVIENNPLPLVSIFVMVKAFCRNIYKDLRFNQKHALSRLVTFTWLYQIKKPHSLAVGNNFPCGGNSYLCNEKHLHYTKKKLHAGGNSFI